MAEANIALSDGTKVTVSGSPEEIVRILELYGRNSNGLTKGSQNPKQNRKSSSVKVVENNTTDDSELDIAAIINTIKDCEEAEAIEAKILDKSDVVNRLMMCLFINEKYFQSTPPLTTGDISKILKQLGVPVNTANVSNAISRKAKSYVMFDGVRTKGAVIRYSLNRRGIQYFKEIIEN